MSIVKTDPQAVSDLSNLPDVPPWGYYRPGSGTVLFRALRALGVSRGSLCRWIRKSWAHRAEPFVDGTIAGVRMRFDIKRNSTDSKLLASSKFYDAEEILALNAACTAAPDGGVFVDVGANTDYYSLYLASKGCGKWFGIWIPENGKHSGGRLGATHAIQLTWLIM